MPFIKWTILDDFHIDFFVKDEYQVFERSATFTVNGTLVADNVKSDLSSSADILVFCWYRRDGSSSPCLPHLENMKHPALCYHENLPEFLGPVPPVNHSARAAPQAPQKWPHFSI